MFLTQEQALEEINRRLAAIGERPTSRPTLYRLRDLYLQVYPKTRWLKNKHLTYGEPVVQFLYFMVRLHLSIGKSLGRPSIRATEMTAHKVIEGLPKGSKFSDVFGSYSAIDTFFEQQKVA